MNKPYSIFHSVGSAGNVRGKQVAQLLGAKINPTSGFENDTCIYVKVRPPENHPKNTYLDVDDATNAVKWLKTHHNTGIIVNSKMSKDYLKKLLKRNDIKVIPHMHCNYENWVRPDEWKVKTVGIIGSKTSFKYSISEIREKLGAIGLKLIYNKDYWKHYGDRGEWTEDHRRMQVVDFYKMIDIQIVWRPDDTFSEDQKPLKNPNKLVNASSFGIPTVSYPEKGFMYEWHNKFIAVNTIDELVRWVEELKDNKSFYNVFSKESLRMAKEYHKDKIIQLYLQL
jgi:hypothetical protein